ncbi:AAC(3) family N-acetyltransferase [Candidatus Pelagibacter sp.]|nr:AAC(3) family N-acetyltransferase [Candidatus Pelagibacter sp.]
MIDEKDFLQLLDDVIDKEDKIIVIYSDLINLLSNINFNLNKNENLVEKILDLIEYKIGKERTLILPSFSGKAFQKKKIFDIDKTIDKDNGLLSLTAFKRKYFRTSNPIHSYIVYGGKKDLKERKFISSYGKNSILEYFSEKNVRICSLGLPWNKGCAYLHRFEQLYEVPWRYPKVFTGKLKKNNRIIGDCYEEKFCSSNLTPLKYNFKSFNKKIEKAKSFKKSSNKLIKLESIKVTCLNRIGKKIFDLNPWIIINNKRETKNWIKNFKKLELENKL